MTESELLTGLTELRDAPSDDVRLGVVRRRVHERLAHRRRNVALWAWSASAATLAAAMLWISWNATEPVGLQAVSFALPEPPSFAFVIPSRLQRIVAAPVPKSRPPAPEEGIRVAAVIEPEPGQAGGVATLLQLPSSDPDVLMYFLIESQGE